MNHSQSLQYNGWRPIFSLAWAQNKNTAQFALHRLYLVFCLLCCLNSKLQIDINVVAVRGPARGGAGQQGRGGGRGGGPHLPVLLAPHLLHRCHLQVL